MLLVVRWVNASKDWYEEGIQSKARSASGALFNSNEQAPRAFADLIRVRVLFRPVLTGYSRTRD